MMRIKISSLIKYNVIIVMLFATSYFKLLGIDIIAKRNSEICVLFILISVLLLFRTKQINRPEYRYINLLSMYVLLMFFAESIFSLMKNDTGILTSYFGLERYLYIFLSGPILYILLNKQMSLKNFAKAIIYITIGSYLIRIIISWYFGVTGGYIFESIATESMQNIKDGLGAIRNGILRVNPPCFATLVLPLCIWQLLNEKKAKRRIAYLFFTIIILYFSLRVHQARSAIIFQIITIVLMVLLHKKAGVKQLALFIIVSAGVIILYEIGAFDSIISTFTTGNTLYGDSVRVRMLELAYYYEKYINSSFFFGIGSLPADQLGNRLSLSLAYDLADLGFLSNIFRNGIFAIGLWIIIFSRWIYICNKLKKIRNNYFELAIGITINVLLWNINIDMFYNVLKVSVPFIVAIMEYIYITSAKQ